MELVNKDIAILIRPFLKRRFLAMVIDYSLIFGIDLAYLILFGESDGNGTYHADGLAALPSVLLWALLTIGVEQWLGATIGNGIAGIMPVSMHNGSPVSFNQSLKRHLLDPIDMCFFGLVAFITIKNSPYKQRLGDMWARTVVIKA